MPRALTKDGMYNRAVHYLERYAASVEGVRAVLQRSVQRAQRRGEAVPEQVGEWIEAAITKLIDGKLLDDALFAETKVRSLRRSGASAQKVRQKLAVKGVAGKLVEEALASEEVEDDLAAAIIFARKKRLGPYTSRGDRTVLRDKQIASLARAGFSLTIARRVVDASDVAELED